MGAQSRQRLKEITAIKVRQWLPEWDKVQYDEKRHRRYPDPFFYLFTLPASDLKALSGICRRTTKGGLKRSDDLGIQRRHEESRSDEIGRFVKFGFPWSVMSESKRKTGGFDDLRKPGWLPTAIVVNVLRPEDKRHGSLVANQDLITIEDTREAMSIIKLPRNFSGPTWRPKQLHPIEVIDGQHRLWAFEGSGIERKFDLPVVAFCGLDISFQAYLFWSINIKPKRINASLAFDLYPLLRTEDWLEKFSGHPIYRETRAQELTEALWSTPQSPWYHRINMLGESRLKHPMVSQAAWIRSLMATYVRSWRGRGMLGLGGLFGAKVGSHDEVLPWSRAQQAAFLILMGVKVWDAVKKCKAQWAEILRREESKKLFPEEQDPAFSGPHTLLNTDQGTRGLLYITNDLCYLKAEHFGLGNWTMAEIGSASDEAAINQALKSLKEQKVAQFLEDIAKELAKFDWRTSSAPGLTEKDRIMKAAFRGGGGYKELRLQILKHLAKQKGIVGTASIGVQAKLRSF